MIINSTKTIHIIDLLMTILITAMKIMMMLRITILMAVNDYRNTSNRIIHTMII